MRILPKDVQSVMIRDMDSRTLRVGIIGAGPVVQSIHLPALARLEGFRVARIADVSPDVVRAVAERCGAVPHTVVPDLLAHADLDIVAVCSPQHLHAEHVEAACRAGVRVVLCEKPFASSREEAERVSAVVRETGAAVVVGAMHAYDPGWLAAAEHWGALEEEVHTVRSSIVMPGGSRFEDLATEVLERAAPRPLEGTGAEREATMLEALLYGLVIHDLPLVRRFAPTVDRILDARGLAGGWLLVYESGDRIVHLSGAMTGGWKPDWRFEAHSTSTSLELRFQPSYVWAGSAGSTVTRDGSEVSPLPRDRNGYEGEWEELAAIARGERAPRIPADALIADLEYAVELAERSRSFILDGVVR